MNDSNPGAGRRWLWVFRALLVVGGLAASANALWLALSANLTLGTALAAVLGLGLLGWGIWLPKLARVRWLNLVAATGLVLVIGLASFLATYGSQPDVTYDEQAIIVLGAAVHGDELSKTLQGRLDTARSYHLRNPAALIVVSGGQGPQENLSEGTAMHKYLIDNKVAPEQVIIEDRATSTEENIAFSRALLDQRLPAGYRVAVITDDFHAYRTTQIAAAHGSPVTHLSPSTPWYFWLANYLREDVMVLRFWITGADPMAA